MLEFLAGVASASPPSSETDSEQDASNKSAVDPGKEKDNLCVPAVFGSFENLATVKKSKWINNDEIIKLMQDFLPNKVSAWTLKRLYTAIIKKYVISCRKGLTTRELGSAIDFFIANGKQIDPADVPKQRWSAKLDMARLLMCMLGDEQAKSEYMQSRQLPDRKRLDNTKLPSLKVQYWIDVAGLYNNKAVSVRIDVGNELVNMYLRANMQSKFRVSWKAPKLREQFRVLRADYESSQEKRNYDQSGQNSDLFYPDFQKTNPSHVMLHYLTKDMPKGSLMGDMPDAVIVDTNAVIVDTNKKSLDKKSLDNNTTIDVTNSDGQEDEEEDVQADDEQEDMLQNSPVIIRPTPTKRGPKKRKRSNSPAVSITSTASAMDANTRAFQQVCTTLMDSFQKRFKNNDTPPVKKTLHQGEYALQMIETKKKLKRAIDGLQLEDEPDEDDIRLLQKHLQKVKGMIQDSLKDL